MTNLISSVGGRRFPVIYGDPPWRYKTFDGKVPLPQRTKAAHYSTMSLEELKQLPVRMVAAKDCVLLLWVVDSHLDQAMALAAHWGFTYKTIAFIWDKGNRMGMGKWTRKQGEICLLFTRGDPHPKSAAVRQIIRAPRREHSRKPDEAYPAIEALVSGPYLELFARTQRAGWASWGDQADLFGPSGVEPPKLIGLRKRLPLRSIP